MIVVENLTKDYGRTRAVDNLSFTLRPGAVTGFLGPNGSGKSTTMRCIVGLDRPTSGRATIAGVDYSKLPAPITAVGAVLDGQAFHPGRTPRKHLQIVASTHGIPKQRVEEVIAQTGLGSVANKRLRGFSLGMGQRLGIATALLGDPQVLIFDEPVNGLDPDGVRWVRDTMRSLARDGRTVLVSSHLMSEMALTADDLVIIGRGRLIASGPISQFTESDMHSKVRVAGPQMADIARTIQGANFQLTPIAASQDFPQGALEVAGARRAEIGHLLFSNGIEVHELTEIHSSLEDVFMELTGNAVDYVSGAPATPQHSMPGRPTPQATSNQAAGFPPAASEPTNSANPER